jgi:RNA exonuclease 1
MQMDIDVIAPTEAYLTQLRSLVDAGETLKRHGFITQPLTHEQLLSKQRCQGCGKGR